MVHAFGQKKSESNVESKGWYRATRRRIQVACLAAVCTGGMAYVLWFGQTPSAAKGTIDGDIFKELKVFTDVIAIVQHDYVKEVENKKLVEGAIKGMLTALDPHSGYLDPDFYQDLQAQTKGEFGGLGIEITFKDGLLVVVSPMEGSPAERAGVKAGDVIVKIQGEYTKEFSLVDAVKRLRGSQRSPVKAKTMPLGARNFPKSKVDYLGLLYLGPLAKALSECIPYFPAPGEIVFLQSIDQV